MSRAVKVGVFLVGGVVLFCAGLFLIGTKSQLFGRHFVVYTQFDNVDTLEPGASVRVGGMSAGEVTSIDVPSGPSSQFRMKLKVDEKFRPIVRRDSLATIETEGMVGNEFVNIAKGSANSPECAPGCTLPSQPPVSMGALMRKAGKVESTVQSTIGDLQHRADSAIENITSAAGHADGLIVAVKPNVVGIAGNANALVAGIRQGHGTAGKLLVDKTMASNVTQAIADARQTTANLKLTSRKVDAMISEVQSSDLPKVRQTLANTDSISRQLNQAIGTALSRGNSNENSAEALRDTIHGARRATTNLADDTDAIKHNFFFRGFFHRRGFFDLETLTPAQYARSEFIKNPRVRVWIPAAGLFTKDARGIEQLTGSGRSIIDGYMSALTPYLPNNPVVVEGYAANGTPAEEYVASRQRATAVRQYLESHFHLTSERVGIMPFGNRPPPQTGKQTWDGISLVLVAWKK